MNNPIARFASGRNHTPRINCPEYAAAKVAFVDIVCRFFSATREHDATKTNAKTAIIDAYRNGEMPAWQAISLIREYELECA